MRTERPIGGGLGPLRQELSQRLVAGTPPLHSLPRIGVHGRYRAAGDDGGGFPGPTHWAGRDGRGAVEQSPHRQRLPPTAIGDAGIGPVGPLLGVLDHDDAHTSTVVPDECGGLHARRRARVPIQPETVTVERPGIGSFRGRVNHRRDAREHEADDLSAEPESPGTVDSNDDGNNVTIFGIGASRWSASARCCWVWSCWPCSGWFRPTTSAARRRPGAATATVAPGSKRNLLREQAVTGGPA